MTTKLNDTEIAEQLAALNTTSAEGSAWQRDGDAITCTFTFKGFIGAFGWMSQIAIWAEKLKHHPEWFNVYRTVKVVLTTHDVQGLSSLDLELAAKMDSEAA